jgi:hypothetical protein
MKQLMRRLRRLEAQFGSANETESCRRLRQRLEAGRRRVAEWREREGLPLLAEGTGDAPNRGRTIVEILNSGRQRNALTRGVLMETRGASSAPIAGDAGEERS